MIIIDANIFCAYANLDDVHHIKARDILKRVMVDAPENVITNDHVFDETISVVTRRKDKKHALELGEMINHSGITIIQTDEEMFNETWGLFKGLKEECTLSFTDCAIVTAMRILGIKKIATLDKEFKKIEGTEVIEK